MAIDHYGSATEMLAALRAREISAAELAELHIARIETLDGELNAIPVKTFDRVREQAKAADARGAAGEDAPLLGLPMTLKESTQTAGLPQSAGIEAFAEYAPASDGLIARAVFDAGAGLLGKTNIPVALSDWQADSPVYGRTVNPWDPARTPGGSTGGGAAALAAGLTPLEVGSDIGGSIRVPAAYCGVYGHRPSETAVPRSGSFPLADLPNPAFLMGVQGPLARTATDLELLFDVLRGPELGEEVGWRQALPEPRHGELGAFRVAVIDSVIGVHASRAVQARLEELASLLGRAGARVQAALPDFDMQAYFLDYVRLLQVMVSQAMPREQREARAAQMREDGDPATLAMADALLMDAHEYLALVRRREVARMAWRDFFRDWDVVIAPMTLDVAFPHQTAVYHERTLTVDNETVPYFYNILFPMLAIFTGLPSTAFPAGLDAQGLPVGLQVIGPYLEDRTTLRFAQLVEREWYRFEAPPRYA
ncbi:MAG TPA: amidase family protein [Pseudomonadales bacterium]